MAFALAIKSKFDLPRVGSIFFLLTLLVTAFTLIYSAFFLEYTLNQCDVILRENSNNTISIKQKLLDTDKSEKKVIFGSYDKKETEEELSNERIINHSFLHEDLNQYDKKNISDKNKNHDFIKNNNINSNYFVKLKNKVLQFNEDYLIPMVNREERISLRSNYSDGEKIKIENFNMKNLKKKFMENNQDDLWYSLINNFPFILLQT